MAVLKGGLTSALSTGILKTLKFVWLILCSKSIEELNISLHINLSSHEGFGFNS